MIVPLEALNRAAFMPFGDVLEIDGITPQLINQGNTQKFADLASVAVTKGGRAQISIYRSKAIALPFRVQTMERHVLGSQAFFPLHDRPFPVVVALPGEVPGVDTMRAFLTNGRQGVNLNPGVWHHYQLTLGQESGYIVIDRGGPGDNCEEYQLDEEVILNL